MGVKIGDNNRINKSVIGENNKTAPTGDGIAKEIIIGVIIAVISGIDLGILGLSNQ